MLAANEAFYEAFASGDAARMAAMWATGPHAQVIHPGAACIAGAEDVAASWRAILGDTAGSVAAVDITDVRVHAPSSGGGGSGELAFVTCVENLMGADGRGVGRAVATNIFERDLDAQESHGWRIVMHHASPFMAM